MDHNEISRRIIHCAIIVHKKLGPGLLESVYQACLTEEMIHNGLQVETEVQYPVVYREKVLEKAFYVDILVNRKVVVELKSVEVLLPVHELQLITYLKLSDIKLGLLINFNVPILTQCIRRKINGQLQAL